jgi:hypothetical protein
VLTGSISNPGRRFQPGLGEIEIAQAHFIGSRLARPAEALFGHLTIFLGRYHHALLLIDAGAHHHVRRPNKPVSDFCQITNYNTRLAHAVSAS